MKAALHRGRLGDWGGYLHQPVVEKQRDVYETLSMTWRDYEDAVIFSEEAAADCAAVFQRDRVLPIRLVASSSDRAAFLVPFAKLLPVERCLIQLATPRDLIRYLATRPSDLNLLHPRKFEEVVAELLTEFDFEVQLTKRTRDDGIDIIAIGRRTPLGIIKKYLVQCKRYSETHKVGVTVVREVLGVGVAEPSTGLMIVTSSSFTQPAVELAHKESTRWRLHLRDYDDIRSWLAEYERQATGRGV